MPRLTFDRFIDADSELRQTGYHQVAGNPISDIYDYEDQDSNPATLSRDLDGWTIEFASDMIEV